MQTGIQSKYVGILLAADRGVRLPRLTGGKMPKHLLEINPKAKNPLGRTILGRLIDQLQNQLHLQRILITIESNYEYAENWLKNEINAKRISISTALLRTPILNWPNEFFIMSEAISKEEIAIIIPGDQIFKNLNLSKIISKVSHLENEAPFLHLTVHPSIRQFYHSITIVATNRTGLEYAREINLNPDNFFDIFRASKLLTTRRLRISWGSPFINVNTEEDLIRARKLVAKWDR